MRQDQAVIVDALRTPMARGREGGALSHWHPVDLLAEVFRSLIERSRIDPATVDDVIVGCVSQTGEQSATPGRQAWLSAGLPVSVPSTTVERKCGSGQQAIDFAAQGIAAGAYDIVIAAGIESMSRVPMGSARGGKDPFGGAAGQFSPGFVPQGVSAELVAAKWRISREALDAYSVRSHRRAADSSSSGHFNKEIIPIATAGPTTGFADETIRPDTTMEKLAALQPAFATPQFRTRFPGIDWKITAGNSSQITDGASGVLLMSEVRALKLGLRPRARIVASAVCGDDPILMLTGPIPATRKVLDRAQLRIADLDTVEVNEAFASVPLAWNDEFHVSDEILNPCGGAISLGHPLGASGCRLLTTMLHHLERTHGRYGLQTMCEAGGMANAAILERI
jgi:acetyl-CoA acyltransferase